MPRPRVFSVGSLLAAILIPLSCLQAQEKAIALGTYDFQHYFEYEELTAFLSEINQAYPELTQLESMAESQMGRQAWMLTINNPATGRADDKPGIFINQIHAGEVIAATSNLYTIWYLLENYGEDDQITDLIDHNVWYVVPRLDVDGAEAYLTGKPAGIDPDPTDSDGDFAFDEDPPEDVDGDGHIVQMRQVDPKGEWKISQADPRIMIRKAPDEMKGTFYALFTEGLDNDGDGDINEDGFSTGFLSNRNYPGNWRPDAVQGGGRLYPMQEGITRAEVDFVASHPNIAIYIQSHCCGRVILRPPTTATDREFPQARDLQSFQVAAARALEHSGWNLATSVFEWRYPPGTPDRKSSQVYRDKDGKLKNAPAGMYEEEEDPGLYGFQNEWDEYSGDRGYFAWGSSIETMYNMFGIFAFADEHWAHPDYDGDGEITEKERLRWNDEEMDGSMYVDWHSFDHPTLGEVEIGGWIRTRNSPPEGPLVQAESEMGNAYKIYMAGLTPRLNVKSEVSATNEEAGIYQVDITVENTGFLSTALEQARALRVVDEVLLEVGADANLEILFGEEKAEIGQIDGNSESATVSFVLRKVDPTAEAVLTVTASGQRALNAMAEVVVR
ncbi:M14 family metallopeptidase [Gemmatimonadota bacterium]